MDNVAGISTEPYKVSYFDESKPWSPVLVPARSILRVRPWPRREDVPESSLGQSVRQAVSDSDSLVAGCIASKGAPSAPLDLAHPLSVYVVQVFL